MGRYSRAFRELHLYPMAAAIWSTPAGRIGDYPAEAFIRFCKNHRLLELGERPRWRTVEGGSREYVRKLEGLIGDDIRRATPVTRIERFEGGVTVHDGAGGAESFDHVVLASHADQSLAMLGDSDAQEREVLGAFHYSRNRAVLHKDASLMPLRRNVWSSWNYMASGRGAERRPPSVTYWMNPLQGLPTAEDIFVSLNSPVAPRDDLVVREFTYEHPIFDSAGACRATPCLVSSGPSQHVVLRSVDGVGLSRGRIAVRLGRGRGARRRAPPVGGGGGVRPRVRRAAAGPRRRGVDPLNATSRALDSAIYAGSVMHRRMRPRRHRLHYSIFSLLLDLDELDALDARLKLFSRNKFNLFSFRDDDYGFEKGQPLKAQVEGLMREAGVEPDGGPVRLLTIPRILGYAFNPLNVYFCYARSGGALLAIVCEVNNTFGQRHAYVLRADAEAPAAGETVGAMRWACAKKFYVSPFMGMDLTYDFRIAPPEEGVTIAIRAYNDAGTHDVRRACGAPYPAQRWFAHAHAALPSAHGREGDRRHSLGSAENMAQGRAAGRSPRAARKAGDHCAPYQDLRSSDA